MKKLLILISTFSVFCLNSCVDTGPFEGPNGELATQPAVYSFNPSSAECGTEITLYGEHFETSPSENFVTFDPWRSEAHSGRIAKVTKTPHAGMLVVSIPLNLAPGDYTISLMANGNSHSCDTPFKIIGD